MPDFSALPALAIKSFNVLDTLDAANDYKTKQALAPLAMQEATDEAGVRHTQYENSRLAQIADEVSTLDPDQQPAAFDAKMTEEGKTNPVARQYVGRFEQSKLDQIRSAFGGPSGKKSAVDDKIEQQKMQQAAQVVSQMPIQQAAKTLSNLNMGKELLSSQNVKNYESFTAALNKARQAGLPVDKILAGRDLNSSAPLVWGGNYAALQQFLNDREPTRKALEQRVAGDAMGIPVISPPHKYMNVSPESTVFDETIGKAVLRTAPRTPTAGGGGAGKYDLTPEENEALAEGIKQGRIDGGKINSRTAKTFAKIALQDPSINLVNSAGHAAMVRNAPLQRTIDVAETLPTVLENVRTAGKKLGYSDVAFLGKLQGWKNGQLNDPDFVSYMTQRNDALLSIANVMRGVGMSDKATEMEAQASNPTMSPRAVDAWANAQQTSLKPRLERYRGKALGSIVDKPKGKEERTIVNKGVDKNGNRVVKYSDGSIELAP